MRILGLILFLAASLPAADPLRLIRLIPLPDVKGRIDHLACDLQQKRIYVAAYDNDTVEVIDLDAGTRDHTVVGLAKPQGIDVEQGANRFAVADGANGKCYVIDGKSLEAIQTIDFKTDADDVRYDPAAKKFWVGYGDGALGIFDSGTGKRGGDVDLGAHPEAFQLEKNGPRIFVNLPKVGSVGVVDRTKLALTAKWKISGSDNYPMALDEEHHRLFVACRNPAEVEVLNTENGNTVAHFSCAGDAGDIFYDADGKRIFVIGGEGVISVAEQRNPDKYHVIDKIKTAPGAQTGIFVPELKRLYVAIPVQGSAVPSLFVYSTE